MMCRIYGHPIARKMLAIHVFANHGYVETFFTLSFMLRQNIDFGLVIGTKTTWLELG